MRLKPGDLVSPWPGQDGLPGGCPVYSTPFLQYGSQPSPAIAFMGEGETAWIVGELFSPWGTFTSAQILLPTGIGWVAASWIREVGA